MPQTGSDLKTSPDAAAVSAAGIEVLDPVKPKRTRKTPSAKKILNPQKTAPKVPRIVQDTPVLPSTLDPKKRRPNYKEPTPDSEWKPWWKPRKRPPGQKGWLGQAERMKVLAEELSARVSDISNLPRDASGAVVYSPELLEVVVHYVSQGGTLWSLGKAIGVPRSTLYKWMGDRPEAKAAYEKAKAMGVDALAEKALELSTSPAVMEDVYESYDEKGKLVRRDVKKGDAVYARKLALNGITSLIAKWAPEKYGEKPEAKTSESMAQRILAARKRVAKESE